MKLDGTQDLTIELIESTVRLDLQFDGEPNAAAAYEKLRKMATQNNELKLRISMGARIAEH